ncbi:methyltransferase domain-containing protein [Clostridium sp. BL-8]|uniref:methyltransferase domain-containing protein n=1 Tax=Clostridium sp. BL-8 TaxID=349938 RepID=UPI00098CB0BB|nr:methyltransferase domain-containing protein [Clostridium sp. BL-8]OOM80132.1 trans-aconitate 2-methyltransferase [Clostridium sp. BL-8]
MGDWSSVQYLMFKNERTQSAIDLANRIFIDNPKKIIDIGCGPGNSSQVLAKRFPNAYILGVDNSANMVEAAKTDYPNLDFKICDVNKDLSILDNDFDVVFSNACIQWIPNHNQLLKKMLGLLKPGGILAIQTPMNYNEPIHKIIGEVSESEKWKSEFSNPRIFYNLTQSEYFDLLSEISSEFSMWETTYCHKLKSHEDIMEWYRGTGLRPYLNVLSDKKKKDFEKDIFDRVKTEYPKQKNGSVIFRFPRFFFIATSKGAS